MTLTNNKSLATQAPRVEPRVAGRRVADYDVARILACPTLSDACLYCMALTGRQDKSLQIDLDIDKATFSRIKTGERHFPVSKLDLLMDVCGNDAPLIWLAHQRGFGLVRLRSEVEEENDRLRAHNEELEKKLEHFTEFLAKVKG